ncbi:MAG: glycosyltransferase [Candidatus Omnitrophica bacterium]|nr:glycosyltransferase [Candidatus Omnitrophota bacterium]
MMSEQKEFFFISNSSIGDTGLSGGDRIYIELARAWKQNAKVSIVGCGEAVIIAKREGLTEIDYYLTSPNLRIKNIFSLWSIFTNFFIKLTRGIWFVLKNKKIFRDGSFVYSSSDFYPDSLPAFIVKLMNPRIIWIAAFYLFTPAPWEKHSPYKGRDLLRGSLYWLSQRPIFWIVNIWADFVFVTSEPDRIKFVTKNRDISRVIVVRGGVNTDASARYLKNGNFIPAGDRKYDACFVGRFHQQKGVLELIDIWQKVVQNRPTARLAMIGNGPLEEEVKKKAKESGLLEKIDFFGFLDGEAKFEIFKQSRLVVHPATFDSGGMAAAEAMAWGLPGVSFDLEALRTYYPQGMVKVRCGDLSAFSKEILKLSEDVSYYQLFSQQAVKLIENDWDWRKRASHIYGELLKGAQRKDA